MMLVNVTVNAFDMQGPMENGVKEIIDNKQNW
jgi:hypothetical protein